MLETFFKNYKNAFLNDDPQFISEVYDFPMVFYTDSGEMVLFEEAAFFDNSKKLIQLYKSLGVAEVGYEIISEQRLSDAFILASIRWIFRNSAGGEIYSATVRYALKLMNEDIRIKSIFVVDEMRKIAELKNAS